MTDLLLGRNFRRADASKYPESAPLVDHRPAPSPEDVGVRGRSGSPQAVDYAELYRQYLPRVLNYMRLRVGDEDLAQDLAAAVFERAVSRQHTLRHPGAFGAWIFRIARTTVAGYYRGHRPTLSLDEVSVQAGLEPSPPEVVMHREELARLRAALGTLSEREQEIVRLKFGGGLGNQEIGQVIHLRPAHVAVLIFRALQKLRFLLEES